MTTLASLNIRYSVYAPNGDRLGQLRDAVSWTVSRLHNGVPSLQFQYPTLGARSDLLESDCEIAVEWNDGSVWREDADSRYFVLSTDRDENDPQHVVTYNCVGYAWMLSKATVVLADIDINPDNQKRQFKQVSVGSILAGLVSEAKARGNLPGISVDFSASVDSNGDPWLADSETISFDRGTDYLSILSNLSDQGVIDWRMEGRTLRVFNPGNTLSVLRANRKRIVTTTTIDPRTYLTAASATTVDYASGGAWVGDDGARITNDVLALGHDGYPRYANTLNYEYLSGVWDGQPTRQLACYRQLGENPDDLTTRAFGSYIAEVTGNIRYVVVIPDASVTNVVMTAVQLLQDLPNGLILQAGTSGTDWFTQAHSGFHAAIVEMIRCGLPVIVLDQYTDVVHTNSGTQVFGIIQNGNALLKSSHTAVDTQFTTQGLGVAVTDVADTFTFDFGGTRPDWINAKRWLQSVDAQRKRSLWMRVLVHSSRMASTALRTSTATAIKNGIAGALPVGMGKAAPKASIDPDVDRSDIGPVVIRYDRSLEAPVTRSIENYAAVAYAYGDSFAKVVVENDAAGLPWGKWETVIGQGGLEDPTTMEPLALQALDQGALAKVSLIRRVALRDCQWLPYRDYDPGDIVLVETATNDLRPYQIKQMALDNNTGGNGALSVNLVMEDTFESREERISRAVMAANGTVGGTARVGGAGVKPQPNSADNRIPLAPANLVVTGETEVNLDGLDYPVLHISWDAVTGATNGAVASISYYAVYLKVATGASRLYAKIPASDTSVDLTLTPYPADTTGIISVTAMGSNGRESDPTASSPFSLNIDTLPPPVPTTPIVTNLSGTGLWVRWDGSLVGSIPDDFARIDVHMGTAPDFVVAGATTYVDSVSTIHPAILVTGLPYDSMRYFRFVSVDRRGNQSAASASAGSSVQKIGTEGLDTALNDQLTATSNSATMALNTANNTISTIGLDETSGTISAKGEIATSATDYPRAVLTDKETVGPSGGTTTRSAVVFQLSSTTSASIAGFIDPSNGAPRMLLVPQDGYYTVVDVSRDYISARVGDILTGSGSSLLLEEGFAQLAFTPQEAGPGRPDVYLEQDEGHLRLDSSDRVTFDATGAYLYGKAYLRTIGGAQTATYIATNTSGGMDFRIGGGTFNFAGQVEAGSLRATNGVYLGPSGTTTEIYRDAFNNYLHLQSDRIYAPGVASVTTTSSANVFVNTADGLLRRVSSLSEHKLDQQEITADYRILEMRPKTWIDRSEAEQHEGYTARTAGFVAEDVKELSDRCDGAFDTLATRDPESGALQGVAYDRIEAYHLPVTADIHRRLAIVETERDELRVTVAQLIDRIVALEARMDAFESD